MPQAINLERSAPPFLVGGMGIFRTVPYIHTVQYSSRGPHPPQWNFLGAINLLSTHLRYNVCTYLPVWSSGPLIFDVGNGYRSNVVSSCNTHYNSSLYLSWETWQTNAVLSRPPGSVRPKPSSYHVHWPFTNATYILPGFGRHSISVESQRERSRDEQFVFTFR